MAARRHAVIRAMVSGGAMMAAAAWFWTQSRWPALDRKLVMGAGGRAEVRGLGFDAVVPVDGAVWEQILAVFVNWCWSNRNGMVFGVVFGALLVTFLATLPAVRPRSRLLGAALGTVVGAPLGVCANCVAPIGQGLASRGERTETVLAAMIASPTLNPAVLGLLFSLFPSFVWGPRLAGLAFLLFAVVPWVAGATPARPVVPDLLALDGPPVWDVVRDFLRALWFLVRSTLPWMALAGLLGATVIVLLPPDSLVSIDGPAAVIAAALVGTFLPVPITFDMVLAATLVAAGLATGPAAALVATLGTWSVYSAAIARQSLGLATSVRMSGAVAAMGMVVGFAASLLDDSRQQAAVDASPPTRVERLAPHVAAICDRHLDPSFCRGKLVGQIALRERDPSLCALAGIDFAAARCALDIAVEPRAPTPPTVALLQTLCRRMAPGGEDGCVVDAVARSGRVDLCAQTATPGACRADLAAMAEANQGRCTGPAYDVAACEMAATLRLASGSRNPALCDAVPEPHRTRCALDVWARAGRETDDPYPCAQMAALGAAEEAEDCRRFQKLAPAILSGDPERCIATDDAPACLSWQLQDPRSLADHLLARAAGDAGATEGDPPWGRLPVSPRPSPDAGSEFAPLPAPEGIAVKRRPLPAPRAGEPRFTRHSGRAFGLVLDGLDATQLHEPFAFGRGIAAGDLDADGDDDLVFGARGGPAIFHATPTGFVRVAVPDALTGLDVMGVRLADMDGDARPDLWVSAYGGVVGFVHNDGSGIGDGPLVALPVTDRILAMALALGDVDQDADLDVVLGTWSFGSPAGFDAEHSLDELWLNDGDAWRRGVLDDVPGETLSNLLTDTDGDGVVELYSANDGPGPDQAFRFVDGRAVPIRRADADALPRTSWFSMCLDSGDIDGDGRLDLVSADMSFPTAVLPSVCDGVPVEDVAACRDLVEAARAVRDVHVAACTDAACRTGALLQMALLRHDAALCPSVPWPEARALCEARNARTLAPDRAPPSEHYTPQVERNLALRRTPTGWEDQTAAWRLPGTAWTWNLQLVDIDADGDLDVHAGNGFLFSGPFPGDAHADVTLAWDGAQFSDVSAAWGLDDPNHTPAFVFVDVDADGDVDRVSTSSVSGPTVHRNDGGGGHRLVVRVDAGGKMRDGVGAHVTVQSSGRAQLREIRASGGFLSAEAPAATFGLGQATTAEVVTVVWPDGQQTRFGPVVADAVLHVSRAP